MKKLIAAAAAVMIMAFSAVPAFALSVNSPIATTQAETEAEKTDVKKDTNSVSPKTGSDNIAAFSAIAFSAVACSAAVALAVKKARK